MIYKFEGDHRFLSNFYPVNITYEGIIYPSVEHAYVAAKTHDFEFKKMVAKLPDYQAGKAKRLGRKVKLRPDWDKVKDEIMYSLLEKKFSTPILRELLLETGDEFLMEGNYWHDNYWGVCNCGKCTGGKNKLGNMLYKIREGIKNDE
jgi:hypothetical protein